MMADIESLCQLIDKGDDILRMPRPAQRQRQWREWHNQASAVVEGSPDLKELGLQLRHDSLAADIGILGRYVRHLRTAEANALCAQARENADAEPKRPEAQRQTVATIKAKEIGLVEDPQRAGDVLKVFLSHKQEDEKTARNIKSALERYAAGRLKVFLSEDIPKGSPWIDWIRDRLLESDMLLLIFTDATKSWDWCLYEAGLFTRLDDLKSRPVVCFHSSEVKPPAPLQHLQTVPATEQEVKLFLKQMFIEATFKKMARPLNPALADQPTELDRVAKEIVALISRRPIRSDHLTPYLLISVREPVSESIPPQSSIFTDEKTWELFGLSKGDWKWEDITKQMSSDEDQRWIKELQIAIARASEGRLFEPVAATVLARRGGRRFLPILYQMDTLANGSKEFLVMLSESSPWQNAEIPENIRTLTSALIMATRFRYEILKRFDGYLSRPGGSKREDLKAELVQAVRNIELESRSHGLGRPEILLAAFESLSHKALIESMYVGWGKIRKGLFEKPGKQNGSQIRSRISKLLEMNQNFITLAGNRLGELIVEDSPQTNHDHVRDLANIRGRTKQGIAR